MHTSNAHTFEHFNHIPRNLANDKTNTISLERVDNKYDLVFERLQKY